ncbi:hypothetical protein LIER_32104 [Lithospermum erythrorhizon]|uniref:F-box domain-containing protein n=1 Tax=Lithospermum erythrorhizon TaxID=34254 RepID=A0AAV3RYA5_LITER
MAMRANSGKRSPNDGIIFKKLSKDRISNLPESIRSLILSFLPTVDAVTTCVLSSKWRNLWTTISSISMDDSHPPFRCRTVEQNSLSNMKFARFANRVLLFHNLQSLKKFSLSCNVDSILYDVQGWISTAVFKNVQELDLSIHSGFPVQLPNNLFTCKTLEKLRLHGSILVETPTNISLPILRTLKLEAVEYEDDECPKKIVSSCPCLKSLAIRRGHNDNVGTFAVSSASLRDLDISKGHLDESTIIKFEINAPNVPCIIIRGTTFKNLKLEF